MLSDTTDPDVWLREELAWARIRRSRKRGPPLFYRRRGNKFRRKSGNIAEFCERWGSRYEFMIVLDADSVMDGITMVELARPTRWEHAPCRSASSKAPSIPAMRTSSLYAYLAANQFAASVYGPSHLRWARVLLRELRQFLGPQRDHPGGCLHRALWSPVSGSRRRRSAGPF